MCPVFLFDICIIVFAIGPTASKAYGLFTVSEMAEQMIVEEFAAIVGIKAQEWKREHFFYIFDLFQDSFFSFAPGSPLFSPSRGDIDEINGVGKHALKGITAMSDGVVFKKTRSLFIPLVGVNGYLFSRERSRLGR